MSKRPESDETLVNRLLPSSNSDPADRVTAWQEWYDRSGEMSVLGFIKVKNDTSEQDMDILQEAMLTAFVETERGNYRPRVGIPFAAYVKGIARTKIREVRRRTRRLISIEEMSPAQFETDQPQLEAVIERQERREALRLGLSKLSHYRRQVLEGYLRGDSTSEIAETLGMSEALVRQHKSRGLRSLREMDILSALH